MEVITEKKKKVETAKEGLTLNNLLEVQQSVQMMLQTSTRLKGKYVRLFLNNLEIIDPYLSPAMEKQNELVAKYAEKDENGEIKRTATGLAFDNDDTKQEFEAKVNAIWKEDIGEVSFKKMSIVDFDEMEIDTSKNESMYLILKYLVNQY